jgi:hypothetical protein
VTFATLKAFGALLKRSRYIVLALVAPVHASRLLDLHVGKKEEELKQARVKTATDAIRAYKTAPPELKPFVLAALQQDVKTLPPQT